VLPLREFAAQVILARMNQLHGLPFEALVEVIAAHDSQSLAGTPESRVEGRILRSIALARSAGLYSLHLFLDRRDLIWLCAAKQVDRYGPAAKRLRIDGLLVERARAEFESHLGGLSSPGVERAFPVIADPSLTPGFASYVATDDEKRVLLDKFRQHVEVEALKAAPNGARN